MLLFYYCGKHTLGDLTLTFIVLFSFSALVPMPNAIEKMIRRAVHLHDEKYATNRFGAGNTHKAPLALPSLGPDSKRILYTIYEYEPLLDSSNMTMDDWINIAKDLRVCNQFEDNTVHVFEQEYEILIVTLDLFFVEILRTIRWICYSPRHRYAVLHRFSIVVYARESRQNGDCYRITDSYF